MFAAVEICLLFPEIDDDGSAAGMSLRHVRSDHVGHGAAAGQRRGQGRERGELEESSCHDLNRATLEEPNGACT